MATIGYLVIRAWAFAGPVLAVWAVAALVPILVQVAMHLRSIRTVPGDPAANQVVIDW